MAKGSLTIVGAGIQVGAHLTLAAKAGIEQADKVVYTVADPVTAEWLRQMNPSAEPLAAPDGRSRRREMYRAMTTRLLELLGQGERVCAVFYGHPGVFADPAHEAIREARRMGFEARMLPGVSAEDCLFADLGVDPGKHGFQSYEVTDFLIHRRRFDPHVPLALWQVAMIGDLGFYEGRQHIEGLAILRDVLAAIYGDAHEVALYEAAIYPVHPPVIERVRLDQLPQTPVGQRATMYVPPLDAAPLDRAMLARLGMDKEGLA